MEKNSTNSIRKMKRNPSTPRTIIYGNNHTNIKFTKKDLRKRLAKKYNVDNNKFNIMITNDLIYNQKLKLVAKFKDYLIIDETAEFLKNFYQLYKSKILLPKLFDYYELNSRVYPNYNTLSESKYIYKNILRKQKILDNIQNNQHEFKNDSTNMYKSNRIINTKIYNSIMNQTCLTLNKDHNEIDEKKNQNESLIQIENLIEKIEKISGSELDNKAIILTKQEQITKKEELLSRNKNITTPLKYRMNDDYENYKNSQKINYTDSKDKLIRNNFALTIWEHTKKKEAQILSSREVSKSERNKNSPFKNTSSTYKTINTTNKKTDVYNCFQTIDNHLLNNKKTEEQNTKLLKSQIGKHEFKISIPKFNENIMNFIMKNISNKNKHVSNNKKEYKLKLTSPSLNKQITNNISRSAVRNITNEKSKLLSHKDKQHKDNDNLAKLLKKNLSNLKLKIQKQKINENMKDKKINTLGSLSERQNRITSIDWNSTKIKNERSKESSPLVINMFSTISASNRVSCKFPFNSNSKESHLAKKTVDDTPASSLHERKLSVVNKLNKAELIRSRKVNYILKESSAMNATYSKRKTLKIFKTNQTNCSNVFNGIKIKNIKETFKTDPIQFSPLTERILRIKKD